jgi:hypothetical protein
MTEASTDFLDPDLLRDAEATHQRPALSSDADDMKTTTTQLPPVTPPPPAPLPTASIPPLPSFPPPSAVPSFTLPQAPQRIASDPSLSPKPSWLRNLLTTTLPPPGVAPDAAVDAPIRASTAGAVFAGMGLFFAVVALFTGLRGAPTEFMPPVVAAALIIQRSLIAIGAGAISFGMFRQAERLLVQPPRP